VRLAILLLLLGLPLLGWLGFLPSLLSSTMLLLLRLLCLLVSSSLTYCCHLSMQLQLGLSMLPLLGQSGLFYSCCCCFCWRVMPHRRCCCCCMRQPVWVAVSISHGSSSIRLSCTAAGM
jgi:hypothetical protein